MNNEIKQLIDALGYDNLVESTDEYYDYYYRISYQNTQEYINSKFNQDIIGIKYINTVDEVVIKRLHRLYWNKNDVPISILVFKDEIRIYNNFNYNDAKALLYSSNGLKENIVDLDIFSQKSIMNNSFWDKLERIIQKSERVDFQLLSNLGATISKISENTTCGKTDAFDFMTKCILIKYLEDRKMLGESTFSQFDCKSFTDVLMLGSSGVKNLFKHLKRKFAGDFFNVSDNKTLNSDHAITYIANFFQGEDIESGQLSLFPYDFSIIPIELISSIYEKFFNIATSNSETERLRKESGSYYTPYFLADYIVNREIIITNENYDKIRILDPACGSGVFLVGAFKRIVNYLKTSGVTVDAVCLNKIIRNQIYGVDKNRQALKITEFSLYIALLDYMEPKDIEINDFVFPKLVGNTLQEISFFDAACLRECGKFDVIIGNPPWKSIKGDHIDYCKKEKLSISDNQIAQAFVYRANDFKVQEGCICFILPNSIFCNTNSSNFRRNLLEINSIEEVLNLSSISDTLFADAQYPCSAVKLYSNRPTSRIHIVNFSPNVFSKLLDKIVLDFNDSFSLNSELLKSYDYLWNIIFSGSFYDFLLIKRMKSLNYTIENLCKDNGLKFSQGFARGSNGKEYAEFINYNILNGDITPYHINNIGLIPNDKILKLERVHDKKQYENCKKIVFRRTLKSNLATNSAAYYEERLLYNNKYYCIFDENNNCSKDIMFYIEAILNSKLYTYYQYNISTAFKINPPEIRLDKVKEFPTVPFDCSNDFICNIVNKCYEIHNLFYRKEHEQQDYFFGFESFEMDEQIEILKEEIDYLIFKLYNLDDKDIENINYTISCRIPITRKRKLGLISDAELETYGSEIKKLFDNLFEGDLELSYNINKTSFYTEIVFAFGKQNEQLNLETRYIENGLLYANINNGLLVCKKIKQYFNDSFSITKTNDKANWQKFNAFLDFQDIINDSFDEEKGDCK